MTNHYPRRGIRSRDTVTILWGYCPAEVRGALRPILLDYLWVLPGWCQTLYVKWSTDAAPDTEAMSSAQPEYRQAQLTICPGWVGAVHASRVTSVIHELLHIPLAPMVEEHSDLTRRLIEDDAPKFHGYAVEQWRRVFEGAVQDLAAAVGMAHGPPVPFVEVEDDDVPSGGAQ